MEGNAEAHLGFIGAACSSSVAVLLFTSHLDGKYGGVAQVHSHALALS